jgi:tetratricopeptide (TPR) repeat protein
MEGHRAAHRYTNADIGIRTKGSEIQQYLAASVDIYKKLLESYPREQLPQQWAMTQNNLGAALSDQGTRTGGEEGTRLLAQAVTAYTNALQVRTYEALAPQWAQTQNNLARVYEYLQDWPNVAACYVNVLKVSTLAGAPPHAVSSPPS